MDPQLLFWGVLGFYVLVGVTFIYVLLCGESEFHRHGCIGRFHYFLTKVCPAVTAAVAKRCLGVRGYAHASRWGRYVMYERNPLMQLFYLLLVAGGLAVFMRTMYHHLPLHHVIGCWSTLSLVAYSFIKASYSDPGIITKANHARENQRYHADGVIYTTDRHCAQCDFARPARAKHCQYCKACVARYDHHCPWVNNCVGANNTHYFMLFLLSTSFMCLYEAYATVLVVYYDVILPHQIFDLVYRDGSPLPLSVTIQLIIYHAGVGMITLGLFCLLAGAAVLGFFLYHLSLVLRNVTTFETFRWQEASERYRLKLELDKEGADPTKYRFVRKKADGSADRELVPLMEKPRNTYYRSLWRNLLEVLFPALPAAPAAATTTTATLPKQSKQQ